MSAALLFLVMLVFKFFKKLNESTKTQINHFFFNAFLSVLKVQPREVCSDGCVIKDVVVHI